MVDLPGPSIVPRVVVQSADFDAGAELARLGGDGAAGVGGIASFIGVVRGGEQSGRALVAMTLEHYPGMTERMLGRIADEAIRRWVLTGCTVIHRVGRLCPGDNIVFVGTASPHREAALQATAFLIDWLKTAAPFWKAEEFAGGGSAWVAARAADHVAAAAWGGHDGLPGGLAPL
ncbi:MAG: molybdenum cofactor biosynthesis protein MoaE [Acidocella sp.]|nr:molybdenum cofactor biosynthesis protein MoaE [Acidocella sp.]